MSDFDFLGKIICGDNVQVLSGFQNECIDLVVTSPPYDDLRTYGGHSWNFETLAAQLVRVLKPGGVIVWVVADATVNGSETGTSMRQALGFMSAGLRLHDTMIYQKENWIPLTHNRYEQAWEYCFVMSKGSPKTFNPIMENSIHQGKVIKRSRKSYDGHSVRKRDFATLTAAKRRPNVWSYTTGTNCSTKDVVAYEHPAIFPESLAADHITSWSNPGDVILDPFSGSGTTCKVAKALNRQWCGIEINPEYCAIAEARLSQEVLNLLNG